MKFSVYFILVPVLSLNNLKKLKASAVKKKEFCKKKNEYLG